MTHILILWVALWWKGILIIRGDTSIEEGKRWVEVLTIISAANICTQCPRWASPVEKPPHFFFKNYFFGDKPSYTMAWKKDITEFLKSKKTLSSIDEIDIKCLKSYLSTNGVTLRIESWVLKE